MADMGVSPDMRRIDGQCKRVQMRSLYEQRASGLHYWLHRHCGRLLMVGTLGDAFEVSEAKLAVDWVLHQQFIDFGNLEVHMCKLHHSQYDEPQDQQERFHKGIRGVFKYAKRPRMCKFCRTKGLKWQDTTKGFRLFNADGEEHKCPGMADLY